MKKIIIAATAAIAIIGCSADGVFEAHEDQEETLPYPVTDTAVVYRCTHYVYSDTTDCQETGRYAEYKD